MENPGPLGLRLLGWLLKTPRKIIDSHKLQRKVPDRRAHAGRRQLEPAKLSDFEHNKL